MRIVTAILATLSAMTVACSPEAVGTAATVGRLQATQAEQAKGQQEQIQKKLGEALKAGEAAASTAGNQ